MVASFAASISGPVDPQGTEIHDRSAAPGRHGFFRKGARAFFCSALGILAAAAVASPLSAQTDLPSRPMSDQIATPELFPGPVAAQENPPEQDGLSAFLGVQRSAPATPGNWVERLVGQLQSALTDELPFGGQRRNSQLSDSFSDLDEYQDIFALAAGWNGDRFFQYRLGLMFSEGLEPVRPNVVAAYYWFCLAAAQGLDVAKTARENLLGEEIGGALTPEDRNDVYLKFIEVYLSGGQEAQYRLGQVLSGDFFNNNLHRQDDYLVPGNTSRRRVIQAYAAYFLAASGDNDEIASDAEAAIGRLVENVRLQQAELERGERVAESWAMAIGMGDDPKNPFRFTPNRVARALARGSQFQARRDALVSSDQALSWLRSGQAYQARGDVRNSKIAFETAIQIAPNSRAAIQAQKQLQQLSTTCSATAYKNEQSKQTRISRLRRRSPEPENYGPGHPLSRVKEISIAAQQRALTALGYYEGPVDNIPGRMTREGFRLFLTSLNLDRRDFLNAPQIVELICQAAQLRNDPASQNVLGVMYASGIGVEKDEDLAHHYFGEAARQNDPSAIFNMGMMYAKERGLPFTNHPQSCSIAYGYLSEALALKHPRARQALNGLKSEPACRGKSLPG